MLQGVTATQQCVSTRCDLWWEYETSCSLLPVFSYMSITPGVSNTLVQPSRAARLHMRENVLEVNAYTTEGFYVMW